jgi:tRNA G10  N-methylase Trm11
MLPDFNYLVVLGRQPDFGIAELESMFGSDRVIPFGSGCALVNPPSDARPFNQLGGSIKLAKIITSTESREWKSVESLLVKMVPDIIQDLPEGKIKLGISVFGMRIKPNDINKLGLTLKKTIKLLGRSARVIPNKTIALNSAQVIHNQLTSDLGCELVIVTNDRHTLVCQTMQEQDIDAYAARDQNRPFRDAKVGMLPPKLAQTIINLGAGNVSPSGDGIILDPFCGTGVILQEAILMGFGAYGSDLSERMIEYSKKNLVWLQEQPYLADIYKNSGIGSPHPPALEIGDATMHNWKQNFTFVAGETYLGKPLSSVPSAALLSTLVDEVNNLHYRFLVNIGRQIKSGTTLCLAVPSWRVKNGFVHLKVLDQLNSLGYTRKKFVHVQNKDLIYYREDQIVARELVVLTKQ